MEKYKELNLGQPDPADLPSIAERGLASDSLENQPDTKTGYSASLPDAAPAERAVPQSSVSTVPGPLKISYPTCPPRLTSPAPLALPFSPEKCPHRYPLPHRRKRARA